MASLSGDAAQLLDVRCLHQLLPYYCDKTLTTQPEETCTPVPERVRAGTGSRELKQGLQRLLLTRLVLHGRSLVFTPPTSTCSEVALRTAGQESAQTYLWATVPHRDIFSTEVSPTQVTLACIKVTTKQTKNKTKTLTRIQLLERTKGLLPEPTWVSHSCL